METDAGRAKANLQVNPADRQSHSWEHSLSFFMTKCIAIFNVSSLIQCVLSICNVKALCVILQKIPDTFVGYSKNRLELVTKSAFLYCTYVSMNLSRNQNQNTQKDTCLSHIGLSIYQDLAKYWIWDGMENNKNESAKYESKILKPNQKMFLKLTKLIELADNLFMEDFILNLKFEGQQVSYVNMRYLK